jgi:hypothetical protein
VRALAVEMHENWLEAMRYLNMDHLAEHKKQMLKHSVGSHPTNTSANAGRKNRISSG